MIAGTIPIKTPQGQAELATRQRGLSQRHRTVLFLIDGKRSVTEVRGMALQAGVAEHHFDELLALGLIMLPEPTVAFMIDRQPVPIEPLRVDRSPSAVDSAALANAAPASAASASPVSALAPTELPIVALGQAAPAAPAAPDSLLPPSRTLYPSLSADSTLGDAVSADSWLPSDAGALGVLEPAVAEARLILLRAVRAEAPLAGSLTMLRLRRARTRADLDALLEEAELRITRPHRALAASQTMQRVRELLGRVVEAPLAPV